jgi:DNA modification methylase
VTFRTEILADGVELHLGDIRDVMPTLAAESVDMVWTDPPYGHANHDGDFNSRLNEHRGIEDEPIQNDTPELMREVVDFMLWQAARVLKSTSCICVCCAGGGGAKRPGQPPGPSFAWLANRLDEKGLEFFHSTIWDKVNPGLGWRYRRQHEMVMVSHRKGGKLLWAEDGRASPNIFSLMPPRERDHPNEKPQGLVDHFIALHSRVGELVLDPFMGSGTTGVVAARRGRRFIGIEIDPTHFETACRRVSAAVAAPDLFDSRPIKPMQEALAI